MIMKTYEEKKKALSELMDSYTKQDLCIAFSGGVDSSVFCSLQELLSEKATETPGFMP